MKGTNKPKTTAALLLGGSLILGTGTVVAAALPSPMTGTQDRVAMQAMSMRLHAGAAGAAQVPAPDVVSGRARRATSSTTRSTSTTHAEATPRPAAKPKPVTAPRSITYTVKPGDTLSDIAAWFRLHGFGALYEANKAAIGDNPDLIFPGQRITISRGVMTLQLGSGG